MNVNAEIITAIATSIVAIATLFAGAGYVLRGWKHWCACRNHPNEPSNSSRRPTQGWLKSIDCYIEEFPMGMGEGAGFPAANYISWDARCNRCHKKVAEGSYSVVV